MGASTVYSIRLEYLLDDKTSGGTQRMNKRLARTGRSADGLSRSLRRVAAIGFGYVSVRAAAGAFIGYNKQVEDAKTNIGGLIMATTGADWTRSIGAASHMMGELRERSAKSTATTMEMVKFMNEVTQPLLGAGLAAKDLAGFTADAVIAAKAFGDEGIAAMDIQQALNQGVQLRDRFSRKLLTTLKLTRKEFNDMGKGDKLKMLQKAVGSKAIKQLGEQQAATFSGVFSTFQDKMQRALGAAGQGLFKEVRGSLMEWSKWLSENEGKVKSIGQTVGEHLVEGFKTIKSVISFFVDHSSTLLMVAKAWAGLKIGGMLGGMAGGAAGGGGFLQRMGGAALAKGFDSTGLKLASMGARIATVGGALSGLLGPIGLFAGAMVGIYGWWKNRDPEKKTKREEALKAADGLSTALPKIRSMMSHRLNTLGTAGMANDGELFGDNGKGIMRSITKDKRWGGNARNRLGADNVKGASNITPAMKLQLDRNLDQLKEMEKSTMTSTKAIAEFAFENSMFKGDLKNIRMDKLQHMRDSLDMGEKEYVKFSNALHFLSEELNSGRLDLTKLLSKEKDEGPQLPQVQLTDSKTPDVKVTIQRIEVKSDDPDRWVQEAVSAFSSAKRNPSGSKLARRIGG